jgi:hypothetical protein
VCCGSCVILGPVSRLVSTDRLRLGGWQRRFLVPYSQSACIGIPFTVNNGKLQPLFFCLCRMLWMCAWLECAFGLSAMASHMERMREDSSGDQASLLPSLINNRILASSATIPLLFGFFDGHFVARQPPLSQDPCASVSR